MDDDDRTTPMGLFNTAEAYRLSAMALDQAQVRAGHREKPIQFLYSHAIELYLKALLCTENSIEVVEKFRHNIGRLVKNAETLGLFVTAADREVFTVMEDTDALIEMRYIRTGAKTPLKLKALSHTCKNVRDSVGGLLRKANVSVRLD
ncbi:MAG: hypothetical protein WAK90_19595 [Pseudolabrys sp.]